MDKLEAIKYLIQNGRDGTVEGDSDVLVEVSMIANSRDETFTVEQLDKRLKTVGV